MEKCSLEILPIVREEDIVDVRSVVKDRCKQLSFSLVSQTKVMTAASELARNTLEHGGGGEVTIETSTDFDRACIKLVFHDNGPGIVDLNLAFTDGYTSKNGMGLGLSGSKRLMDSLEVNSIPGEGTTVVTEKWR